MLTICQPIAARTTSASRLQSVMPREPNARLDSLMSAAGLKNADLARRVGTSRQMIGQLRKDERTLDKGWAVRLAPYLGINWWELLGAPSSGLAESPTVIAPPPKEGEPDFDEQMADIAEAVAGMLADERMPTDQRSITLLSQQVWRDIQALGTLLPFADRLDLTLSEHRSAVRQRWFSALKTESPALMIVTCPTCGMQVTTNTRGTTTNVRFPKGAAVICPHLRNLPDEERVTADCPDLSAAIDRAIMPRRP